MPALRRIVALAVLAVWLPATLHCALEAAGLDEWFGCHEEAAHDTSHCTDDACHAVEGLAYKPDVAPVKVPPPAPALLCHCLLCLAPSFALPATEPPTAPPEPPALVRSWQFARRAAPPARAPSHLV